MHVCETASQPDRTSGKCNKQMNNDGMIISMILKLNYVYKFKLSSNK